MYKNLLVMVFIIVDAREVVTLAFPSAVNVSVVTANIRI